MESSERDRLIELCNGIFITGEPVDRAFTRLGLNPWKAYEALRGLSDLGPGVPTFLDICKSLRDKRRVYTYEINPCKEDVKGRYNILPYGLL